MSLPAYGRDLLNLQRSGKNVAWLLVSLDWDLGKAFPRLVVPDNSGLQGMDFAMTQGLSCWIAHRGKLTRALDVAEAITRCGGLVDLVTDRETGQHLHADEVQAIRGAV